MANDRGMFRLHIMLAGGFGMYGQCWFSVTALDWIEAQVVGQG